MMRYFTLLLFFALLISCDGENKFDSQVESHFVKFYGEDGDHEGVDFVINNDGSFILLGNERVAGSSLRQQIYLVKVDALGMVVWQRSFGSTGDDFAKDIELTPDGRIIIAAESQKGFDERDVYLKTLSLDGAPLDSVRLGLKTLNSQESDEEVNSISIIQGGFIVSGSTTAVRTEKPNDTKDAMHLRFTNTLALIGTDVWSNSTGIDDSEDVLVKMIEINASTYYGFGYTNTVRNSIRDFKYWVFRLGANGIPTEYGTELLDLIGSPSTDDKLGDVIVTSSLAGETEFVLNGIKSNTNGLSQSFIIKLDKNPFRPPGLPADVVFNPVLANETPTDLGLNVDGQVRIASSLQGGFLSLSNNKELADDKLNISLTRLSNTFSIEGEGEAIFGGLGDDFAGNVKELPDGKIMIVGTMTLGGITGQTKMVLMKLNAEGKLRD